MTASLPQSHRDVIVRYPLDEGFMQQVAEFSVGKKQQSLCMAIGMATTSSDLLA